jgi:RimJ/RimL family protein N-acetyltransferase
MNEWANEELGTERLICTPLTVSDAGPMAVVLGDPELYRFTGGRPLTAAELAEDYQVEIDGSPTLGLQWFNWIIRLRASREPIGYLQATVRNGHGTVAWVVGTAWQGNGYAQEAAPAMCQWLRSQGARSVSASLYLAHGASARVAEACGLEPTGEFDDDGEQLWQTPGVNDQPYQA